MHAVHRSKAITVRLRKEAFVDFVDLCPQPTPFKERKSILSIAELRQPLRRPPYTYGRQRQFPPPLATPGHLFTTKKLRLHSVGAHIATRICLHPTLLIESKIETSTYIYNTEEFTQGSHTAEHGTFAVIFHTKSYTCHSYNTGDGSVMDLRRGKY